MSLQYKGVICTAWIYIVVFILMAKHKLHVPKDKAFRGMLGPKRAKYHLYDQWDWITKWRGLWEHKFWLWIVLNWLRICPVVIIRYRWYLRCWTVQLCIYSGNIQCKCNFIFSCKRARDIEILHVPGLCLMPPPDCLYNTQVPYRNKVKDTN